MMVDQIYNNMAGQSYQNALLNSYLYGTPMPVMPSAGTVAGGTTPSTREQYEAPLLTEQQSQAEKLKAAFEKAAISYGYDPGKAKRGHPEAAAPMTPAATELRRLLDEMGVDYVKQRGASMDTKTDKFLATIANYMKNPESINTFIPSGSEIQEQLSAQEPQTVLQNNLQQAQQAIQAGNIDQGINLVNQAMSSEPISLLEPTLPAETVQQTTIPTQQTQQPVTGGGLAGQIMAQTPEQISAQYDILRKQGMQGIADWQAQAMREMEQRGISQGGGYLGSLQNKDTQAILANALKQQTELGQNLGLSELQTQMAQPYQQLSALTPLQQYEQNYGLSQQQTYLDPAIQFLMAPWGQATSRSTQLPGMGVLPGAYLGAATAGNIYNMANQLGWWNSPATAYGGGIGGQSFISSPLAGTGLQSTWNTYMPSF